MTAAVFTERVPEVSPDFKARIAGIFWLLTIVTGAFAMYAGRSVVVGNDAAATAANLLAHQPFYRLGIAADVAATACYLTATIFVYSLLKPVQRNVSLLAAFFSLTGCAIGAASFVFRLAPLAVLGGTQYLTVFPREQLHALARLFLRLYMQAATIGFVFFGLHCLLVGLLIVRSAFLNRIIGGLMMLGGLSWLTYGVATIVAPPVPQLLIVPGIVGEASLSLWLIAKGVRS